MRSDPPVMSVQTESTPAQRAANYLKRIAALTGAKRVYGCSYWLRAGRRNFLVDSKFVRVISARGESTCFSVVEYPDIPRAEMIPSAFTATEEQSEIV